MKDRAADRDVIEFIYNQSALAARIKPASAARDCAGISLKTGLTVPQCRSIARYVPSEQDVSDHLSHKNLADCEAMEELGAGNYYRLEIHTPWSTSIGGLQETMDLITALGIAQNTECDSVG